MDFKNNLIRSIKKNKQKLVKNAINIPGQQVAARLVVFESDDWGSIRLPSSEVYERLLLTGDKVDKDPFTRYDSLASEDDLSCLFEILSSYRDWQGNSPVITANCAVANPDFEKIEASGYREYYYEPFTETLGRYPKHKDAFRLWQQGLKERIFFPQLHCREHINIRRWMKHLHAGKYDVLLAFSNKMISTGDSFTPVNKYAYMDAFNFDADDEMYTLKAAIRQGAELFKQIFGYYSKSFIAPCYIWSSEMEDELRNNGIEYIQGSTIQLIPLKVDGTKDFVSKWHYFGELNRHNQIFLMRNCDFEPSWDHNVDWVDTCLSEIATAFRWKKPATISTHRLNYIGYIDEKNRDNNLKLLSLLLGEILKRWPDAEFKTSVELGEYIRTAESS